MTNKKKIAVALAATMTLLQTGVFAQEVMPENVSGGEVTVQPRYVAIDEIENSFSISGGTAYCYGFTDVSGGRTAKTIVELQKKGISWTTVKTWTKTSTNEVAEVEKEYAVTSGTYRIKVTHQALNGTTVVEEEITYSGEVTK